MSEPYNGKCPICRGQLIQSEVEEATLLSRLICENGDYECSAEVFEAIWIKYTRNKNPIDIDSDGLLITLLKFNSRSHPSKDDPDMWLKEYKEKLNRGWDEDLAKMKASKSK